MALSQQSKKYMTTGSHRRIGTIKEIQLKDAKATLSAVVDRAVAGEPTVITRHGRREAVLVSFEEWEACVQGAKLRRAVARVSWQARRHSRAIPQTGAILAR